MSLKAALYSYLTSQAGLTALVGNRIYPDLAPPNAVRPYIVYGIISSEHVRNMLGASGFCSRRVQFDIYGSSAISCESVFTALAAALEAKRGNIGSGSLAVLSSGIESERDNVVPPTDGSQVGKHRRTVDYLIWHRL
jgi:hypothetical protein